MVSSALTLGIMFLGEGSAFAAGGHEAIGNVMVALLLMLLLAKLGGDLMIRIGQPAVLGELIFGILLGNLALFMPASWAAALNVEGIFHDAAVKEFVEILSELGVMLLLFEVGLESTVREMMSVGKSSVLVALLGVGAPVLLGFGVGELFLKGEPYTVHLFLGAVLAATSVGITARVLGDLGKMQLRESKIILGAAVIDDVLGLIVMAVAVGMVAAVNEGRDLDMMSLGTIVFKAMAFFLVAMAIGGLMVKQLFKFADFLRGQGMLVTMSLIWMFFVAWLGAQLGLAPIIGAFAAGLVLEDISVKKIEEREGAKLVELLHPLTAFLVPVFFIRMGMEVNLRTFADVSIMGFAAALTFAAIIGKQICSLGVVEPGLNRWVVGVGMIPRGEVGLIVAGIGRGLRVTDEAGVPHPLIDDATFSAVVIMVIITTMITPPLLSYLFKSATPKKPRPAADEMSVL